MSSSQHHSQKLGINGHSQLPTSTQSPAATSGVKSNTLHYSAVVTWFTIHKVYHTYIRTIFDDTPTVNNKTPVFTFCNCIDKHNNTQYTHKHIKMRIVGTQINWENKKSLCHKINIILNILKGYMVALCRRTVDLRWSPGGWYSLLIDPKNHTDSLRWDSSHHLGHQTAQRYEAFHLCNEF